MATPSQEQILQHCQSLQKPQGKSQVVRFHHLAIKYGTVTPEEAANQRHVYDLLDPNIGRVPKVHAYFTIDGIDYLVMDYISDGMKTTINDEGKITAVARLVSHLHSFTREKPGPAHGERYHGSLWQDSKSPSITCKSEFERYITSRLLGPFNNFAIGDSPLVLNHGDLAPRNLIFGADGLWLLDWESAGYFPRSAEIAALNQDVGCVEDAFFRQSLTEKLLVQQPLAENERLQVQQFLEFALNCIRYTWGCPSISLLSKRQKRKKKEKASQALALLLDDHRLEDTIA